MEGPIPCLNLLRITRFSVSGQCVNIGECSNLKQLLDCCFGGRQLHFLCGPISRGGLLPAAIQACAFPTVSSVSQAHTLALQSFSFQSCLQY